MRKWLNFYSYILWFICSHVFVAKISCLDLLWCLFPVLLPTLFCTLCVAYDLLQRRWWETSWEVLTWLLMTMNSNRGNWRERGRENLDVREMSINRETNHDDDDDMTCRFKRRKEWTRHSFRLFFPFDPSHDHHLFSLILTSLEVNGRE